jgi:hypothetical protein
MSANIWAPGSNFINVDAQSTNVFEAFIATAGQTLYVLSKFTYTPNTASIAVYRNGQRLLLGVDFEETSSTRITLTGISPALGEQIVVYAVIGSASESALAAAASAVEASDSAAEAAASAASLADSILPDQAENAGKYLSTDGDNLVWQTVDALPEQTGNAGKVLTTDGTDPSWVEAQANKTTFGLFENAALVTADYVISAGNNAISAGPITIDSGVTVTVPAGSVWTIV